MTQLIVNERQNVYSFYMVESNILLIALQQTKNNGKIKEYILYGEHVHFQYQLFD